jgi:hydrogenase nickel incorporation protein HypA/HybF
MHELPVTQSILEIALRHAEQANGSRITDIYLVIGQLSSFVDDSIQFYWDIISAGTIAVGATLHFKRIQAELICRACQHQFLMNGESFCCPTCGSGDVEIRGGDEFFVEAISIERDEVERSLA